MVETKTEISEIIKTLGIDTLNQGASTGSKWLNTKGEKYDSFSPVDGELIASVNAGTAEDYETLIQNRNDLFGFGHGIGCQCASECWYAGLRW